MANNKVHITPELKSDLRKYMQNFSSGMTRFVADEMKDESEDTIDEFYADYEPKMYERHYYNLRNNMFDRFYYNPHSSLYKGGIEINNKLDAIYTTSTEIIFNLVLRGNHGGNIPGGRQIAPMRPSPMELLYNKRTEIMRNINNYEDYGYYLANKGSYSTIRTK